jgi:hypothetical protein
MCKQRLTKTRPQFTLKLLEVQTLHSAIKRFVTAQSPHRANIHSNSSVHSTHITAFLKSVTALCTTHAAVLQHHSVRSSRRPHNRCCGSYHTQTACLAHRLRLHMCCGHCTVLTSSIKSPIIANPASTNTPELQTSSGCNQYCSGDLYVLLPQHWPNARQQLVTPYTDTSTKAATCMPHAIWHYYWLALHLWTATVNPLTTPYNY